MGAFDAGRAQPRARPARVRGPARLRHVRHLDVRRARHRPPLRRRLGPEPRRRRLLRERPAAPPRRLRAPRRSRRERPPASPRRSSSAARPSWSRSTAAGDLAPTHPDLDPVWDTLAQADVPFVLHVGGGGRLLDRAFHNNAMPVTDHLGGGENIRSKDFLAIHDSPALFLGALIYDGLFDRFPTLRGGCIEQGAGLGRVLDAPPRLRPAGLPPHRGAAAQPRATSRATTSAATSSSRPSPARTSAG